MKVEDKVAVVSGAGSGLGRASAIALAAAGARVHMVDIAADRLNQACAAAAEVGWAHGHVVDCADADAVQQLADQIFAAERRVDLLQNGVGVMIAAPVEQMRNEDWKRVLEINVGSTVNAITAFLPRMLEQGGGGHIVNVSSVAGLVGFPYTAAYSTSKFALVGLSEALSAELHGQGISVTVVCPGMFRSNLMSDGNLNLPGDWASVVQRSYDRLAPEPEVLARQIIKAVEREDPIVVPSIFLAQLWRAKRLFGRRYLKLARQATRGLIWARQRAGGGPS